MARLGKLKSILAELKKAGFDPQTLPTTSSLNKLDDWLSNPENRKRADGSVPNSGKKVKIGIKAFGYKDADDDVIVTIGARSNTTASGLASKALLGHVSVTDQKMVSGFIPAKVILGTKVAATTKTSEITAQKYKSSTGTTYTIPFGKNGTNTEELTAQDAIIGDSAITTIYSVTFTPEKLRRR